jgi:site-specific recombinase XerD
MALDTLNAKDQFIEYLKKKKRARATIVAYGKDIDQTLAYLRTIGKVHVEEVTQDELEAFVKKLGSDNYTPKSVSRKINSIKTFFRFLKTTGNQTTDPAHELEHPKFEVKPPRILTRLEYRALRDACRSDTRIYAIVELFLQTGLRIAELASLTLPDIRDNEIVVKSQENHPERLVPLNKAAKEAIQHYILVRGENAKTNALFITKTGKSLLIRNIRTAIDRYFRIAGIEGGKVNDLRHTFIAHHLMAGTPITTLSKLVGHKRISTTEKYLELVKGQKLENVKLGEL